MRNQETTAIRRMAIACIAIVIASVTAPSAIWAQAVAGSCEDPDPRFQRLSERRQDRFLAFVLRDDVPQYRDESGRERTGTVRFNEPIFVYGRAGQYLRASLYNASAEQSFYIASRDVLCAVNPLKDPQTHLERKAFIKTETAERKQGQKPFVYAYKQPEGGNCDDNCRKLSRFELYMIFAETQDSLLLADDFLMDSPGSRLTGWIKRTDAIGWNWAVGIRPPEDLTFNDGPGAICSYRSVADAEAKRECLPILGGRSWFKNHLRIPIIKDVGAYYEVAVPSSGTNFDVKDGKVKVDPDRLGMAPTETISAAFNVDVFFVIDGTKSMRPYIDRIRGLPNEPGILETVLTTLSKQRSQGARWRFGFRVYRDSGIKRGDDGVGEGMPLQGTTCDNPTDAELKRNHEEFQRRIGEINTSTEDSDDYPENVYGGIEKALSSDVFSCPKHVKFVIVLGDAGYDAAMQVRRGFPAITEQRLADRVNAMERVRLAFMRMPFDASPSMAARNLYDSAYAAFQRQGEDIVGRIRAQTSNGEKVADWVHTLDLSQGVATSSSQIVKLIQSFTNPTAVSEILVDLRGGAALAEVIERLKTDQSDVPIFFWNMIKEGACKELGDSCNNRIYQAVSTLFIPKSEKHQLDVWMPSGQLAMWVRIFGFLKDQRTLAEQRDGLVNAIVKSLEDVLGEPTIADTRETFEEYIRRSGKLPLAMRSPLMSYSQAELRDPSQVPECEIYRLLEWIRRSDQMLSIAQGGNLARHARREGGDDGRCQRMSSKGRYVPLVDDVKSEPPGDTNDYSLQKTMRRATIYWVPQEYLP